MAEVRICLRNLIDAFHILHRQGVLDGYGHIAVRNPADPSTFFDGHQAPNVISSPLELNEWNVADGSPVANPHGGVPVSKAGPFTEHHIHASIFQRFSEVTACVHSHAPEMIAWSIQKEPELVSLKACSHKTGYVGASVPVFDYHAHAAHARDDRQNLLINTKYLGDRLAEEFGPKGPSGLPERRVVLQHDHGFVALARGGIVDCVFNAVFAVENAKMLSQAMRIAAGRPGYDPNTPDGNIYYLTDRESKDCFETHNKGMPKAWPGWVAEVRRCDMYTNTLADD